MAAGDQGYVFPMIHRVRELEAWLRDVRGFQHTYCDSMQTEEEFEKMFDHGLYRTMREKYGADKVFPTVYAKTRPEMDIFEWIEEEKEHGAGAGEGACLRRRSRRRCTWVRGSGCRRKDIRQQQRQQETKRRLVGGGRNRNRNGGGGVIIC